MWVHLSYYTTEQGARERKLLPVSLIYRGIPQREVLNEPPAKDIIKRAKRSAAVMWNIAGANEEERTADIETTFLSVPKQEPVRNYLSLKPISEGERPTFAHSSFCSATSLREVADRYPPQTREQFFDALATPILRRMMPTQKSDVRWVVDIPATLEHILRFVSVEKTATSAFINQVGTLLEAAPDKRAFLRKLIVILQKERSVHIGNITNIVNELKVPAESSESTEHPTDSVYSSGSREWVLRINGVDRQRVRRSPRRPGRSHDHPLGTVRNYPESLTFENVGEASPYLTLTNLGAVFAFIPIERIQQLVPIMVTQLGDQGPGFENQWKSLLDFMEMDGDRIATISIRGAVIHLRGLTASLTEIPASQRTQEQKELLLYLTDIGDELSGLVAQERIMAFLTMEREGPEPGEPGIKKAQFEAPIRDMLDLLGYRPGNREFSPDTKRERIITQLAALYWEQKDNRSILLQSMFDTLTGHAIDAQKKLTDATPEERKFFSVTGNDLEQFRGAQYLLLRHGASEKPDGNLTLTMGENTATFSFAPEEGWQFRIGEGEWKSCTNSVAIDELGGDQALVDRLNNEVLPDLGMNTLTEDLEYPVHPLVTQYQESFEPSEYDQMLTSINKQGAFPQYREIFLPPAHTEGLVEHLPELHFARYLTQHGCFVVVPTTQERAARLFEQADETSETYSFRFATLDRHGTVPTWQSIDRFSDLFDESVTEAQRTVALEALTTAHPFTASPRLHRQSLETILTLCDGATQPNERGQETNYRQEALAILDNMYQRTVDKNAFLQALIEHLRKQNPEGSPVLNREVVNNLRGTFQGFEQTELFTPAIELENVTELNLGVCTLHVTPTESGNGLTFKAVDTEGELPVSFVRGNDYFGRSLSENTLGQSQWRENMWTLNIKAPGRTVIVPLKILDGREELLQKRDEEELKKNTDELLALTSSWRHGWGASGERFLRNLPDFKTCREQHYTLEYDTHQFKVRFDSAGNDWYFETASGTEKNIREGVRIEDLVGENIVTRETAQALQHFNANIVTPLLTLEQQGPRTHELVERINLTIANTRDPEQLNLRSLLGMQEGDVRPLSDEQGVLRLEMDDTGHERLTVILAEDLRREYRSLARHLHQMQSAQEALPVLEALTERVAALKQAQCSLDEIVAQPIAIGTTGEYTYVDTIHNRVETVYAPFEDVPQNVKPQPVSDCLHQATQRQDEWISSSKSGGWHYLCMKHSKVGRQAFYRMKWLSADNITDTLHLKRLAPNGKDWVDVTDEEERSQVLEGAPEKPEWPA